MTIEWMTALLDVPAASIESESVFWQGATASSLSPPKGASGQFSTFLPDRGDPYLRMQRIDEGPADCHVHWHVLDVPVATLQAQQLGATLVADRGGFSTLRSPGGLRFCIVTHHGHMVRPAPVTWPDGHRSLVDQLSIDAPPSKFDRECDFWAEFSGWECRQGALDEFKYLVRPPAMPLRILLQRLVEEGDGICHGHLDFACDDVNAERERHVLLGAVPVRETELWTTLRDPAGLDYCLTRRNPDTGMLA
jgi:Glyoxalase-like domain